MRMAKHTKPWTAGPRELLAHAFEHLAKGNPFDFRIAMISIDNAVELAIKTYLSLPKRIRGSEGPSSKRLQEAGSSFPGLLDLLEEFAKGRLSNLDLGDIEVYHHLRNRLYHDGNGITVDPEHVDSYLQIAKVLLNNLLGIELEKDESNPPSSLLGGLVSNWASLVQEVRLIARSYLDREESPGEPVLHTVDKLITKGILDTQFRRRLRDVNKIRNKLMHSVSVPLDEEDVRNVLKELDGLLYYLKSKVRADTIVPPELDRRRGLTSDSDQMFTRLERIMPDLLTEMRKDLTEHPLSREFVVLKKGWSYWGYGYELAYYFEDHPELENKLRILLNYSLIQDVTHTNVSRYIISEELARYLGCQ